MKNETHRAAYVYSQEIASAYEVYTEQMVELARKKQSIEEELQRRLERSRESFQTNLTDAKGAGE